VIQAGHLTKPDIKVLKKLSLVELAAYTGIPLDTLKSKYKKKYEDLNLAMDTQPWPDEDTIIHEESDIDDDIDF
jgi:hypothetical protein